jgi:hypothetical protein
MKISSTPHEPCTSAPPSVIRHWNEDVFRVLTRVIDAVAYDQPPGMKIMMVAEYLSRTSRREIPALMRKRPRRTPSDSKAKR